MEKSLRKYDRECVKMAMLKHEETFRQQVHELHRLYRVQKLLMRDLRNAEIMRPRIPKCSRAYLLNHRENIAMTCLPTNLYSDQRRPTRALNLELPADEYIERAEEDDVEQGINVELTLTLANSWRKGEDATYASDSTGSFSSSSTESRAGLKSTGHEWGMQQAEDVNVDYQDELKNQFEFEAEIGEERMKQQSPWLFQCLSLRMA